jgi:hypothetical protein
MHRHVEASTHFDKEFARDLLFATLYIAQVGDRHIGLAYCPE